MHIDNLLILSAGLGTRMGPVGEILPKPLWPFFNRPLLHAQILLWNKFNPRRIFINAHHCSEKIIQFIKSLNDSRIVFLYEDELLGSGGPFFCVKKKIKQFEESELLFAVNADFLMDIDEFTIRQMKKDCQSCDGVLLSHRFLPQESYNRLITKNDFLVEIKTRNEKLEVSELNSGLNNDERITFSGVSCFNLKTMDERMGPQSFFDSVANYKNKKIKVIGPLPTQKYDFGTIDDYIDTHLQIVKQFESGPTPFIKELENLGVIPNFEEIVSFRDKKIFKITHDYRLVPETDDDKKNDERVKGIYYEARASFVSSNPTSSIASRGQDARHK